MGLHTLCAEFERRETTRAMEERRTTPLKAIRAKCLDCCGGSVAEVKRCPCADCSLYPYRFGKNPRRSGVINKGSFLPKNNGSIRALEDVGDEEGIYTTEGKDG